MTVVTDVNGLLGLQLVIAVLLPAVVGLVTTRVTEPRWKSVLLLGLTAVTSVAQELATSLQAHTEFRVFDVLMVAAGSYVLSMAVHLGVMNPLGLKDKLQSVGITADPLVDTVSAPEDPYLAPIDMPTRTTKHRADG